MNHSKVNSSDGCLPTAVLQFQELNGAVCEADAEPRGPIRVQDARCFKCDLLFVTLIEACLSVFILANGWKGKSDTVVIRR